MTKNDELVLFEQLSRNSKFKEWLEKEASTQSAVLEQSADIVHLHRAQGAVGTLNKMQKLMVDSVKVLRPQ